MALTPQQLYNKQRQHIGRIAESEDLSMAMPIQNMQRQRTQTLSAPISDGGRYYGRTDDILSHTSRGGVQAGFTDPGAVALRVGATYAKNEETHEAAELGLVIVRNSDGSWLCVSRVAF